MAGVRLGAVADDLLHLTADVLQRDAHGFQGLGGNALTLVDKPQEDVLGADVVVVEHACFLLRQNDDAASTVSKPLEHYLYLSLLMCHPL